MFRFPAQLSSNFLTIVFLAIHSLTPSEAHTLRGVSVPGVERSGRCDVLTGHGDTIRHQEHLAPHTTGGL